MPPKSGTPLPMLSSAYIEHAEPRANDTLRPLTTPLMRNCPLSRITLLPPSSISAHGCVKRAKMYGRMPLGLARRSTAIDASMHFPPGTSPYHPANTPPRDVLGTAVNVAVTPIGMRPSASGVKSHVTWSPKNGSKSIQSVSGSRATAR